jgi:hypothetical protein
MAIDQAQRLDLATIKRDVNLVELVSRDTELRKESVTNGGSYAGRCPFCGGTDRFVVRMTGRGEDGAPVWWCRICTGEKGQSAIDYVMRRDHLEFKAAAEWLAHYTGNDHAWAPAELAAHREEIARRAAESRERQAAHEEAARGHMAAAYQEREFQDSLSRHAELVASLEADGIPQWAQEQFRFGYTVKQWKGQPVRALTLPWYRTASDLEVVQYRLLDVTTDRNKYLWPKGMPAGTFWNGSAVREPDRDRLIVCEGAKKGATVYSTGLYDMFGVTAVQNNSGAAGRLRDHRGEMDAFDRVYVILDPGSEANAVEAARQLSNGYVVFLPDKVDEWLVSRQCDAYALLAVIDKARRP